MMENDFSYSFDAEGTSKLFGWKSFRYTVRERRVNVGSQNVLSSKFVCTGPQTT